MGIIEIISLIGIFALTLVATYKIILLSYIVRIGFITLKKVDFYETKKYVKVKLYGDEKIGILKKIWLNIATMIYIESEIDERYRDWGQDWKYKQAK